MSRAEHPTMRYRQPEQRPSTFTLHLTREVYDHVLDYAETNDVTRNKAINEIIAAHAAAQRRRQARRLKPAP